MTHDGTKPIKISRKETENVSKRTKEAGIEVICNCTLTKPGNAFSDSGEIPSDCFVTLLIRLELGSCISFWKITLCEEKGPLVKSAGGIQVKVQFTVTPSATELPILSRWDYFS